MSELRDYAQATIQKLWGPGYHKELEKFLREHEKADHRVVESETGILMYVRYDFAPYTVLRDHLAMREEMQKVIKGG